MKVSIVVVPVLFASAGLASAQMPHMGGDMKHVMVHRMMDDVMVMVIAIVAAVGVMMFAAKPIGEFVDAHPTIKILALAFLVLVGATLIAEGLGTNVPKGYIYFAMAFSFAVEMINIRMRKARRAPVHLRKDMPGE